MFYGDLEFCSHKVYIDSWPPSEGKEGSGTTHDKFAVDLSISENIYDDRDRSISRSDREHLQYFIRLVIKVSKVDYMIPCPVGRSYKLAWASCSLCLFGGVSLLGDPPTE